MLKHAVALSNLAQFPVPTLACGQASTALLRHSRGMLSHTVACAEAAHENRERSGADPSDLRVVRQDPDAA